MMILYAAPGQYGIVGAASISDESVLGGMIVIASSGSYAWTVANTITIDGAVTAITAAKGFYVFSGKAVGFGRTKRRRNH